MTKQEVINWCRENLHWWPRNTMLISPPGWQWQIKQLPYQLSTVSLVCDTDDLRVCENDVFK